MEGGGGVANTWLGDLDLDADLDAIIELGVDEGPEVQHRCRGSLQEKNNIKKLVIHLYDCNLV